MDRYNNCVTGAAAVAVLEHIACGAADLTIILGIICHSAVVTLHMAANNSCSYGYEDCMN